MSEAVTGLDRRRLMLLACFFLSLFALLIAQYFRLQILEGELWQQKADRQHFFTVEVPAQRGLLYGSTASAIHPVQSVPLVVNVRLYHLHADPQAVPKELKHKLKAALTAYFSLMGEREAFLAAQLLRRSRSRRLGITLEPQERQRFEEWWRQEAALLGLPRHVLFLVPGWCRRHPCGSLLGQLMHTVRYDPGATALALPTGGAELAFDPLLRGRHGRKRLMRSPHHTFETGEPLAPARDGADIHLTIDPYIQAIVEEELAHGVQRSGARAATAVMMNPANGAILALGQVPAFHPDQYAQYFNAPESSDVATIKAISEAREPGSVMKPLTVALALVANEQMGEQHRPPLFLPQEKFATASGVFPGRSRPLQDTTLHRYLNMYMAIRKSSNIYMGRLMERLLDTFGPKWYREQLTSLFGLGIKTGIELPGESGGFVPFPGALYADGKLAWSKSTPFSLAIGYNLQATALQLVRAYAVLANGGYLVQPTLLHRKEDGRQRVIETLNVAEVVNAMKFVTKTGGSASRADIFGYTEAGKSSTAKKIVNGVYSETLYSSSFIGFAPAHKAAFVLLVTVDEPAYGFLAGFGKNHHGGNCAGAIFKAIGRRVLPYLGIASDDPHGYPRGDPRRADATPDWHLETQQLQELYERWNNG